MEGGGPPAAPAESLELRGWKVGRGARGEGSEREVGGGAWGGAGAGPGAGPGRGGEAGAGPGRTV